MYWGVEGYIAPYSTEYYKCGAERIVMDRHQLSLVRLELCEWDGR